METDVLAGMTVTVTIIISITVTTIVCAHQSRIRWAKEGCGCGQELVVH
ncbi:MAG: hypothetical protein ACT6FF_04115 [Methanosarcinaceae archaeon]